MKQIIKNYGLAIISILFLTFLTSLILSILDINKMISIDMNVLLYSFSYCFYALISFVFGVNMKKKGIIHGISLFMILFLISFSLSIKISIIHTIVKFMIITFFTILGVNKKNS